jgi:predicted component of type VI protein secretion system
VVRLQFLSGRESGNSLVARRFPFTIGRATQADLSLPEPGVWEEHLSIELQRPAGFVLRVRPSATVLVNGRTVTEERLHNGDLIQVGPVRLRFSLSEMMQKSWRPREVLTWCSLVGVCLLQLALVYWFLP